VSVLKDTAAGTRRPAMAGTQLIDREWGILKEGLPKHLSARTAAGQAEFAEHIRAGQWTRMLRTEDRWPRFCEAAAAYRLEANAASTDEPAPEQPDDGDGDATGHFPVESEAGNPGGPLLGPAVEGVPRDVHEAMENLASQGVIPVTTHDQRAQLRFTPGSWYGVPAFLSDARKHGYIGPNLPPPAGFTWKCANKNEWSLCPRGGEKNREFHESMNRETN
jgi:hypothetical protein